MGEDLPGVQWKAMLMVKSGPLPSQQAEQPGLPIMEGTWAIEADHGRTVAPCDIDRTRQAVPPALS